MHSNSSMLCFCLLALACSLAIPAHTLRIPPLDSLQNEPEKRSSSSLCRLKPSLCSGQQTHTTFNQPEDSHITEHAGATNVSKVEESGSRTHPIHACGGSRRPSIFRYEAFASCAETWPPHNGSGCACVGGRSSGHPFWAVQKGSTVWKLEGWQYPPNEWTDGGVQALRVTFFNGHETVLGSIPSNSYVSYRNAHVPDAMVEFEPGETISDIITTSANGFWKYYTHVGYIAFSTSRGQYFELGREKYFRVWFDAEGKTLSGLFGRSEWNLDQIGFILTKSVKSAVLQDVKYGDFSPCDHKLLPTIEKICEACNYAKHNESKPLNVAFETGVEYKWSTQRGMVLQPQYPVDAAVLVVSEGLSGAQWVMGDKQLRSHSSGSDFQNTVMNSSAPVLARSCTTAVLLHWVSSCEVSYTGIMHYTFTDGSEWKASVKGQYSGVYMSAGDMSFRTGERLKNSILRIACVVCGLLVVLCTVVFKLCFRRDDKLADVRW